MENHHALFESIRDLVTRHSPSGVESEVDDLLKAPLEIYLIASAKEEAGAVGALYFTRRQELDALIALQISPIAPEYTIADGVAPVLLAEDSYGLPEGHRPPARHQAPTELEL